MLVLDLENDRLLAPSNATPELAVVDLKSGESKVIATPGIQSAAAVAYDPKKDLAFIAGQATDNVLIVSVAEGRVLHDVETGAGALYVTYDPVSELAFVGNRGAGTITAVSADGEVKANLKVGSFPNQLLADGKGTVWAVNKSAGENDESGDKIWKITPKAAQ